MTFFSLEMNFQISAMLYLRNPLFDQSSIFVVAKLRLVRLLFLNVQACKQCGTLTESGGEDNLAVHTGK